MIWQLRFVRCATTRSSNFQAHELKLSLFSYDNRERQHGTVLINVVRLQRNRARRAGKLPQVNAGVPLCEVGAITVATAADVVRTACVACFEHVVFAASFIDETSVGDLYKSHTLFVDVAIHPRKLKVTADRHFGVVTIF